MSVTVALEKWMKKDIMNKEELIKVICATVLKEPSLSKNDMEDSNKCGRKSNYKNIT